MKLSNLVNTCREGWQVGIAMAVSGIVGCGDTFAPDAENIPSPKIEHLEGDDLELPYSHEIEATVDPASLQIDWEDIKLHYFGGEPKEGESKPVIEGRRRIPVSFTIEVTDDKAKSEDEKRPSRYTLTAYVLVDVTPFWQPKGKPPLFVQLMQQARPAIVRPSDIKDEYPDLNPRELSVKARELFQKRMKDFQSPDFKGEKQQEAREQINGQLRNLPPEQKAELEAHLKEMGEAYAQALAEQIAKARQAKNDAPIEDVMQPWNTKDQVKPAGFDDPRFPSKENNVSLFDLMAHQARTKYWGEHGDAIEDGQRAPTLASGIRLTNLGFGRGARDTIAECPRRRERMSKEDGASKTQKPSVLKQSMVGFPTRAKAILRGRAGRKA